MKKNLSKMIRSVASACTLLALSGHAQTVQTFSYSGSVQQFTVPSCVTTLSITARGGAGASAGYTGGSGGSVFGVITVTAGQVFYVYVGGAGSGTVGGFNGGGNGGTSPASAGGGGGGASDIRFGGTALSNRILVAAGGGGSGGSTSFGATPGGGGSGSFCSSPYGYGGGGASGCATGNAGGCSGGTATGYGTGGGGGGLSSGGATAGSSTGTYGGAGSLGTGGDGGSYSGASYCNGGGGGGAGYYGGAGGMSGSGGCNGGGGGGSSYINNSTFSSVSFTAANNTGNGIVYISYVYNGTGVAAASTPSAVCNGTVANLSASGVVSYTWLPFPGFAGSNSPTLSQTPSVTTTYTVQGTNALGCLSTAYITVPVNQSVPVLTVANTSTVYSGICPGQTVVLNATGATTYSWTGAYPVTNGVPFQPATSSGYTLTGGNACGISTAATSVAVLPTPTVTAVASQPTICSGVSVSLTASGASTYSWSNGVPNGVGFTPATTATYVVTGTAAATGCTATAAVPVTVVTTPILAPVASPTLICNGFSSTLSASGASNYSWSPGQTTSSIVVNPTTTTSYVITKWNANCFDTKTITLIVNQPPTVFAIANPTVVCAFQSATLNAGGGSTYTWAPYGGNSSQAIVAPGTTTDFTVTASDGTCSAKATVSLAVNPLPVLNITTTGSMICAGQQVNLTISGADSYSWTNPTGLGTATAIADSPLIPTSYNVTGTNTLTGCQSSTSQVVIVNPVPTLTVAATKTLVCVNGPSTLTVKGLVNNYTYSWNTGASTTATSNVVNSANTTVYSVTATNTITSCQSTSVVTVNVFQPTFAVNSPTSSCLGGTITLMASGANSYTWNGSQPFQNIQVSPTTPTFYVVAATTNTINNLSCVSSNTVTVNIYSNPTVTAVPSRTLICRNESVDLTGGGATTYTWSNLQTGSVITVSPNSQTNYVVTGTDQNGCTGTATLQVKVSPCSGIDGQSEALRLSIYPNPSNGEVTVQSSTNLDLTLVDELGQVVRQLKLSEGNNRHATVSGLAAGIYFITDSKSTLRQKLVISK